MATYQKTALGQLIAASCREQKMLAWLKSVPSNAIEARLRGVNHPVGRINGLRNLGHDIDTLWTEAILQAGKVVKVALYVMKPCRQTSIFDLLGKPEEGLNGE